MTKRLLAVGRVRLARWLRPKEGFMADETSPVLADKIIEGRPYAAARDAVERGMIPESIFNELSRSLKSA